ncbi:uncharacterized protein LOC123528207 [Mercenaria mercenaria]|uniref:uncharacterized protein LOC123528207 n=1 Tax=Mercenaria mercenaria TaxID=6596 RepID=UPI00234F5155|nr:uncharacterized protein LOC123528207 [Mercenaria mercenaria]
MRTLMLILILVFWIITRSFAIYQDEDFVTLVKRIEKLEQQHSDSHSKIERLERQVIYQSKIIESQTEEIKYLKDVARKDRALLQQTNRTAVYNKRRVMKLWNILLNSRAITPKDTADPLKAESYISNSTSNIPYGNIVGKPQHPENLLRKTKGRSVHIRQERTGVAFSTYLDHDVDLGLHQTIRFNQVITNEGNGYNPYSGIFTCPEAGMYLLSFFIGERADPADVKEMAAELMINNVNIVNAVVDSFHRTQDLQGGNTVVIRLKQGDVVWVSAVASGIHVEGSSGLRISTFSGVFLYA